MPTASKMPPTTAQKMLPVMNEPGMIPTPWPSQTPPTRTNSQPTSLFIAASLYRALATECRPFLIGNAAVWGVAGSFEGRLMG